MRKTIAAASAAAFILASSAIGSARADSDGLVVKESAHDVPTTMGRLETGLSNAGLTVFIKVDHAAGAEKAGMKLRPTQLIIFGNPKMGTALMNSNQEIGIDLPLKFLVWEDDAGITWVAYNDPKYLADRHDITDRDEVFKKMSGALGKMSDNATQK